RVPRGTAAQGMRLPEREDPLYIRRVQLAAPDFVERAAHVGGEGWILHVAFQPVGGAQVAPAAHAVIIQSPGTSPRGPAPDVMQAREVVAVLAASLSELETVAADLPDARI